MAGTYFNGTGRRKRARASVWLTKGQGQFLVNDLTLEDYFSFENMEKILKPFRVLGLDPQEHSVKVNANGGGSTGQAEAVIMGLARALVKYDEKDSGQVDSEYSFRRILREHDLLTRDSRQVERKKVGLHKARKATQYSKR